MRTTMSALLAIASALLAGCAKDDCDVVVYTNIHQIYSEPALEGFATKTGLRVCPTYPSYESKATGVLGQLLDRAEEPPADVFWSEDPVRPWVLVQRGMVVPYLSSQAQGIPDAYKDARGLWTGVGAQARVLVVNTRLVPENKRPKSIRDLGDARWKGRGTIPNPRHGTTLVNLAALASRWGDEKTQAFLSSLDQNGTRIGSTSWEATQSVAKGEVAFGLTNSDHAYEALAGGEPLAVVYPDQEKDGMGTLLLPTSVMLLKGPHPEAGRRLVDHLVSPEVEARLVASGAYLALRPETPPFPGIPRASEIRSYVVDPAQANEAMERMRPWLDRWFGR